MQAFELRSVREHDIIKMNFGSAYPQSRQTTRPKLVQDGTFTKGILLQGWTRLF